jgi:cyclin D5
LKGEKDWAIRLLSIACLSLAAKMEEYNVPGLSKFQLDDNYFFDGKVVQKMELFVLSTLDWNMGIITPFSFLSYFIKMFCNESSSNPIVSNTMQPIFTVIMEGETIINT